MSRKVVHITFKEPQCAIGFVRIVVSIPPVKPHLCQGGVVVGQYIDKYIIQGGLTLLNFKTYVSHGQCDLVLLDHLMTLVGRRS